ncbi:MAG: prolyl oligopeptidase family serine peptidase [Bacteroidota bacterium]
MNTTKSRLGNADRFSILQVRWSKVLQARISVSDLYSLARFSSIYGSQFDLSFDGNKLAYCVREGLSTQRQRPLIYYPMDERSRLFIVQDYGKSPTCVELPEGFGAATPRWSPSGRFLAASMCNGHGIQLGVFDTELRGWTFPTDQQLALTFGQSVFEWNRDDLLSFAALPAGQTAELITIQTSTYDQLLTTWQTAKTAMDRTGRVFDTDPETTERLNETVLQYDANKKCLLAHIALTEDQYKKRSARLKENYPPDRVAINFLDDKTGTLEYQSDALDSRILLHRDNSGTFIYWTKSGQHTKVAEFDRHLAEVEKPFIKRQKIDGTPKPYRKVMRYKEDKDQPVVLMVYPGQEIRDVAPKNETINTDNLLHTSLLTSSGLCLVEPAVPLTRNGDRASDVLGELVRAVEEAVSGLIDDGYGVEGDIHLFGHSLGGWAVPMLLAECDCFASGIASAGIYDVSQMHLHADPRQRYTHTLRPCLAPEYTEYAFGLPSEHWTDPQGYAKLSPIFQTHKIEVPLLMLHGDMDYVPATGAEAMLNSMRMAGKKAQLVRYTGEDHIPCNPYNLEDYFDRITDFVWDNSPKKSQSEKEKSC